MNRPVDASVLKPAEKAPPSACEGCRTAKPLPMAITMAFQPIVNIQTGRLFAYEALVRGVAGESAGAILSQIDPDMIYRFDQTCRVKAIELAGGLFPRDDDTRLSINFMPNAVYEPEACIRASLAASARVGFSPRRLMFEFTENERMTDTAHVLKIIASYKAHGFTTAIDDFGSGYSGLNLLAELTPDLVKLDMDLLRGIDSSFARQRIVANIVKLCSELGITCIAEGIETAGELGTVRALGIELVQGYLIAAPQTERLPEVAI
ncbi:EAL domain-containing protein [Croceicoccus hydrothermalis]|uniref:EAL domain-containing protein n=1 Tax=Croceicoccus hydrothermalis TaxID=2867964 RepID=UPI0030842923